MLKQVYLLVGGAVFTNLPLHINGQSWQWQTYSPSYTPTYNPTQTDPTFAPTSPNLVSYVPTSESQSEQPTTETGDKADVSSGVSAVEILTCPESFSSTIEIDDVSTLSYAIVLPSNPTDESNSNGILCGKLTSDNIGWIGLGISPDGQMSSGSVAIIGVPDDNNSVQKYAIGTSRSVNLMSPDQQTLRDTNLIQEDGMTTMTFTKLLIEPDEIPILGYGNNFFIHARGISNTLGYHGSDNRLSFEKNFGDDVMTAASSPTPAPFTIASVPEPSPSSWNDRPAITNSSSMTNDYNNGDEESNSNSSDASNYVLPGESGGSSSNVVSSMQAAPTSSGASLSVLFACNGRLVVVSLLGFYFV
jgi:hypothetical protein